MRRWDRPFWLADYLSRRDVACPGCGYNLRGLRRSACPECGSVVEEVTLQARETRPGPLLRLAHLGGFMTNLLLGLGMLITWFVIDPEGPLIPFFFVGVIVWLVLLTSWAFKAEAHLGRVAATGAWIALSAWIALGAVSVLA